MNLDDLLGNVEATHNAVKKKETPQQVAKRVAEEKAAEKARKAEAAALETFRADVKTRLAAFLASASSTQLRFRVLDAVRMSIFHGIVEDVGGDGAELVSHAFGASEFERFPIVYKTAAAPDLETLAVLRQYDGVLPEGYHERKRAREAERAEEAAQRAVAAPAKRARAQADVPDASTLVKLKVNADKDERPVAQVLAERRKPAASP